MALPYEEREGAVDKIAAGSAKCKGVKAYFSAALPEVALFDKFLMPASFRFPSFP